MIVPHFTHRPKGDEVTAILRLERAITRLGALHGFDGDPLLGRIPDGRTLRDLSDAHDLLQSLPAELRNFDRRLALRMCQAAVFGRTRPVNRSLPPQESSKPTADAKLARERNRRQTWRASA